MSRRPIDHPAIRDLNMRIDTALLEPARHGAWTISHTLPRLEVGALAERVRRRATLIAHQPRARTAALLEARDSLIAALYARDTPRGWHIAWCDGASKAACTAGVGGLLMDREGHMIARWARVIAPGDPFSAEIAALATTLERAAAHGVGRLRVYSDCVALVRLWHAHRADPRLDTVREHARRLEHLQLHALPRLHNQPANRLAREALCSAARVRANTRHVPRSH